MAEPSPFRGGTAGAAVECGGCTRAIRYTSTAKGCDRIGRGCSYLLTATCSPEFRGRERLGGLSLSASRLSPVVEIHSDVQFTGATPRNQFTKARPAWNAIL